ncbi:G-protein alpha subunit [Mycena pura]|uniref:G-protein alpha subunit n=1 Tax=Mycena pura TaxID=153505 RepID=A0AAD6US63_9AGAR|nr:G-protein alpha subunit [Mycena pura]
MPVKILLLGSGQSGKSTILKQFEISDVRSEFKSSIFSNVVAAMRTILKMMPELDIGLDFRNDRYREIILGTETMGEIDSLSRGVSRAIKMLCQDPGAQKAISYFSRHELSNSAEYFLYSIERLAAENYVPTTEDILLLRVKTTGIYQKEVEFDGQTLIVCDTGGERSERKKWVHGFPGTTAVFFLVALNDYQGTLEENEENRMDESFALWRDIVKHDSLKSAKFILLFNKLDLFVRHFEVDTFSAVFPDYETPTIPGNEALKALTYLRLKFLAQVHSEREVYTYEVSATDTDQFRCKRLPDYQVTVYIATNV